MLHSKFGGQSLPQKKKSSIRPYLLILFLISILSVTYWSYHNYERLLFHFKKDKYANIVRTINDVENFVKEKPAHTEIESTSPEELLTQLIKDNPGDSYLYFLFGRLYTIMCVEPVLKDSLNMTDVFFLDYINRFHFPAMSDARKWEKGISQTRKALLLGLQETEEKSALTNLVSLYLIGGTPYWSSAKEYLTSEKLDKDSLVYNIYNLIYAEKEPDWILLSKTYGDETVTFWIAIFNLKIKNYPLAFFNLKKLLISDSVYLRNNAYYIMGYIMGEQKDMNLKMYYHGLIDFEEFLKRNPWFLEEHHYTLRFMGQHDQAKRFLQQYEKLVLELKEPII